jgi:PhzF family phenazine biosynthesis protein
MELLRIAAFADGEQGGNPAGVYLSETLPPSDRMQSIAADVGYSETVFAASENGGWRVRYFSPESEVPFCGHATIALGAALAMREGVGVFNLQLNDAAITVEGYRNGAAIGAALQSPPTRSHALSVQLRSQILELFGYRESDLSNVLPAGFIHAGADHVVIALNSREKLAAMTYPFERVKTLMTEASLVTIMWVYAENERLFHSRNAFAYGGVVEDPATGAATAAFAGYLRDLNWPHQGKIEVVQGEDMGALSRLIAEIPAESGSSIRVSGSTRML